MQALNRSASQPVAAPFNSVRFAAASDHTAAAAAGHPTSSGSVCDNPTHIRAQAWMQHRQQELSVPSSQSSAGLDTSRRPDRSPGRLLMPHSMHNPVSHTMHHAAPHSWHDSQAPTRSRSLSHAPQAPTRSIGLSHAPQIPTRSTSLTHAASRSFTRRQSEPAHGLDEEWPVVGTPPVHAHKAGPLHLPPPSPLRAHPRPQAQQAQAQQPDQPPPVTPFGLQGGWAAGLARGAEWMGEATGLRFLVRPFQRSAAVDSIDAQPSSEAQPSSSTPSSSRQSSTPPGSSQAGPCHTAAAGIASTASSAKSPGQSHAAGDTSGHRVRPASAPSHGGASYRERLLSDGFTPNDAAPAPSFSRQPGHQPLLGFPSQQELQASQACWAGPSSSSDASGAGFAAPVSQLSGLEQQMNQVDWASRQSGLPGPNQPDQSAASQASHGSSHGAVPQHPMQAHLQPAEQAGQLGAGHAAAGGSLPFPNFDWPAQVIMPFNYLFVI